MSMRVLEEIEKKHESHICNCCLEQVIEIVLGGDDDEGVVEKVGDLYLELYGEEGVSLGLVEKVRLLEIENIDLNERINLLETKLKRLEN